jgi:methenyltetrahydromethanopterin cyclohydrolase
MSKPDPAAQPSVNLLGRRLLDALVVDAAALRLGVAKTGAGALVIDAGAEAPGGIEAGRRIAEICMGGLGQITLVPASADMPAASLVAVHASDPVLACLGSQYAGWRLQDGNFFAMASGPGRAVALKEDIFAELGYCDKTAREATFVLEGDKAPPDALVARVADACQ